MSTGISDMFKGIGLEDNEYRVVQSLFRGKYKAYDSSGDLVLQGKQKKLSIRDKFPFLDGDGNSAFTVKAGGLLDISHNYVLIDDVTGEEIITLDKSLSLISDRWKIRESATDSLIAEINSASKALNALRSFIPLIPHKYEITGANGHHIGSIKGKYSLKDEYVITIDDGSAVPTEAIIAAAMVIDAIEDD